MQKEIERLEAVMAASKAPNERSRAKAMRAGGETVILLALSLHHY